METDSEKERQANLDWAASVVTKEFPSCARVAKAYFDCHKMNKGENKKIACQQLGDNMSWCMTSQMCPKEAQTLELCTGYPPPKRVPLKCILKNREVNKCMERVANAVALQEEKRNSGMGASRSGV